MTPRDVSAGQLGGSEFREFAGQRLRGTRLRRTRPGRTWLPLWADMSHVDPNPYELELIAVDSCKADDVIIAAAAG